MRLNSQPTVQEWLGNTDFTIQHSAIGAEKESLLQQRKALYDVLMNDGLPSRKWAQWRYLKLGNALQPRVEANHDARNIKRGDFPFINQAINLVLVDGVLDYRLSDLDALPEGVKCVSIVDDINAYERSMQSLHFQQRPFVQISALLFQRGFSLTVAKNAVLTAPIHLIHVSSASSLPTASHAYNVISLEANARLKVFEQYVCLNDSDYLNNTFTHWLVDDNVDLTYIKLQSESRNASHFSTTQFDQSAKSQCNIQYYHWGAELSRENLIVNLNGPQAQHQIKFLSAMDDKRQSHAVIQMNHRAHDCRSCQQVRSLADDKAQVSINGKIYVAEGASKTQADLQNKNLLLSSKASIYTQPDLEIYNDDVICSHGATVGSLDEQAIFYLCSRGIPYKQARRLLLRAFVAAIFDAIPDEALGQIIASHYRIHFHQNGETE